MVNTPSEKAKLKKLQTYEHIWKEGDLVMLMGETEYSANCTEILITSALLMRVAKQCRTLQCFYQVGLIIPEIQFFPSVIQETYPD